MASKRLVSVKITQKKPVVPWSIEEVAMFLSLLGDDRIQQALDGARRNETVYRELSARMAQNGFQRTWLQCREKQKKMKCEYNREKVLLATEGYEGKVSRWYKKMDSIYGQPRSTFSSLLKREDETDEIIQTTVGEDNLSLSNSALAPIEDEEFEEKTKPTPIRPKEFITDIDVSRNENQQHHLKNKGFSQVLVSLNHSKDPQVFLWIRKSPDEPPITRIQFSFNEEMSEGLKKAGYTEMENPLMTADGAVSIWVFRGTSRYDVPIETFGISDTPEREAEMMRDGLEKVGCNISASPGLSLYIWVKREKQTFVCDVAATNSYDADAELFQGGFIRMDEPTNSLFDGYRSTNFLWYRLSADPYDAITDLQISTNAEEFKRYTAQQYRLIDVNLNKGTGGRTVYLWYNPKPGWGVTQRGQAPLKNLLLLHHQYPIPVFQEQGVDVIQKNINDGNTGAHRYLCFRKETKNLFF